MDRISATIIIREVNNKNDGTHPKLTPKDARRLTEVNLAEIGGETVYAITAGSQTLLVKATDDKPTRKLVDFRWVNW